MNSIGIGIDDDRLRPQRLVPGDPPVDTRGDRERPLALPIDSKRDSVSESVVVRKTVACLSEAALHFALELDLSKLFQLIARESAKLVDAEGVLTYSISDGKIQREGWFPSSRPNWPKVEPLPPELLQMISRPEPLLGRPQCRNLGAAQNAMFVPLIGTQNRLLGIIEFHQKRWGGIFSDLDLEMAVAIARIATAAVDRARLFSRIEDWSKSIEMLLSFNAAVNQHHQPAELVRQLLVNAAGFVDANGGAAGLVIADESSPAMECDAYHFEGTWYPFKRRWGLRQGVVGTVLETQFPLLLSNYSESELADPELVRRFELGPCICVAIKNAAQTVLGFFKLHRRPGKPEFTWQEAALLESLGSTAAVAIENAGLVKSLELKNEQVKKLSAATMRRLEAERQHIARELHDETGQVLIGLKLRLQLLARRLEPEQIDAIEDLKQLREQVNQAAVRLNRLAKHLRPPTLDELGFEATLRQLVNDYRTQFNFPIQLEIVTAQTLSEEAETALYRIVQEGLTNVFKHAQASRAVVKLFDQRAGVGLTIQDDGCGFDERRASNGLGLIGLQERVKMLSAEVTIESRLGEGTTIRISNVPTK